MAEKSGARFTKHLKHLKPKIFLMKLTNIFCVRCLMKRAPGVIVIHFLELRKNVRLVG